MLKKIIIGVLFTSIVFISLSSMLEALPPEGVFFDGFEDGLNFTSWVNRSVFGFYNSFGACGVGAGEGSWSACSEGGGNSSISLKTLNDLSGYKDCNLTYLRYTSNALDAFESMEITVSNQTANRLIYRCVRNQACGNSAWTLNASNLTELGMLTPYFNMTVWGMLNDNGEEIGIDAVNITCIPNDVVADTCTYTSGDWDVDCSDNCVISSNVVMDANSELSVKGTGTFTIRDANITNYKTVTIAGTSESNRCDVYLFNSHGLGK